MKIGLISDSHDHIDNIRKAVQVFKDRGVSLVIHAGDIVSPPALKPFEGMRFAGIFGNNDGEQIGLMKTFGKLGGELGGDFLALREDGLAIAVYHGTVPELTQALVACGKYDLVITGHTHKRVNERVGASLLLNPGSAHGFDGQATVMVMETAGLKVETIEL